MVQAHSGSRSIGFTKQKKKKKKLKVRWRPCGRKNKSYEYLRHLGI